MTGLTEKEKMLSGQLYHSNDPVLKQDRNCPLKDTGMPRYTAGNVVTHDVPSPVLATGNPCRIIRHLTAVS